MGRSLSNSGKTTADGRAIKIKVEASLVEVAIVEGAIVEVADTIVIVVAIAMVRRQAVIAMVLRQAAATAIARLLVVAIQEVAIHTMLENRQEAATSAQHHL